MQGLIACGEGALRLVEVQRGGKAPMAIAEFLRGRPLAPGMTWRRKNGDHIRGGLPASPEAEGEGRAAYRYALTIEYDGAPFRRLAAAGQWRSPCSSGSRRRFAALEWRAARRAWRRAHRRRRACAGAGRPMSISTRDWREDRLRDALNAHLRPGPDRRAGDAQRGDDFEARFSAIRRHYRYVIRNRRAPLTLQTRPRLARRSAASMRRRCTRPRRRSSAGTTSRPFASTRMSGQFAGAHAGAARCARAMGDIIEIVTCARSFLHNQVRSLAGSLEHVGSGKWSVDDLRAALEAKDRTRCGQVAPPHGLYLVAVDY